MRSISKTRALFLGVAFAMVAAGCGSGGDSTSDQTDSGDGGSGGSEEIVTLTIAASATPQTLDGDKTSEVESWEAQWNTYDQLVGFDLGAAEGVVRPADIAKGVVPMLAEEISVSDDGLTTTFKLREGVTSAFGNTLTTEDVRYSFERMAEVGAVRSFVMFVGGFSYDDITIEDELTFSITTEDPSPLLLPALGLYLANIYDSTEVQKHATESDPWAAEWLGRNTAGFGAYNVTTLESGQRAVFTANPNYWGGKPAIDQVIYQEVPESSNRLSLLNQGAVDIAKNLTPTEQEQVAKLANYGGGFMTYVHINLEQEPFGNPQFREALAYATPYDVILDTVYRGNAKQLRGPIMDNFPDFFGDDYFDYTYDPTRATELLAEAGFGDGVSIELFYNTAATSANEVAVQLKTAWDAVGINTTLTGMDATTFGSAKQERQLGIFIDTNLAMVPDVGYTSLLWFQPDSILNYGNYVNDRVTVLAGDTLKTIDPAERTAIARELQEVLINDLPFIFLAQPGFQVGLGDRVESISWYPNTALTFKDIVLS